MNTWKPDLETTKQRYIDWWNHKGIVLNMWEHLQEGVKPHADVPRPAGPADLNQKWFDPQWRADYLDWYVAHSSLKADILPVANTQLGPGSLAAILGGVLEGGEDTIWIHPDPHFDGQVRFDENHPNWKLHKDLLKACKQKAQGHYYVGMPDLMEGLDILAALKGTDKVLEDLLMQPEWVEEQMQRINDIYFRVFDELYEIIREGDEMAFCYFSSWAPGKMSKIQCDISTMISEEDYRRFVQPYLREQCQKIPYTLYHLDGVGAMRHLPALLEIEELNAIQWTPGVGEPQGGSPKWYDLYKKILAGGKSLMACWVEVDEIKPLLDTIGPDGVHLEMNFHNEREIEQAEKIIEEYRPKSCGNCRKESPVIKVESPSRKSQEGLVEAMKKRVLVLDGATGTTIQQYQLGEPEYRGPQYRYHKTDLKGCNDLLCLTRPDVVADVHRRFIEAGADIVTTNTFNAQRVSLQGFHIENKVREINLAAAVIARSMAGMYTTADRRIYVAGSIGPTSKCVSLNEVNAQVLQTAYEEQALALIEGGVDALLIETIFDTANAGIALDAAKAMMKAAGREIPILMSFTMKDPKGFNMLGQDLMAYMKSLAGEPVACVGLNCSLGAAMMLPFLRRMADELPQYIIAFPNAGLPNKDGLYDQTPQMMQQAVRPLVQDRVVNIVGGCCGTEDTHIREIAKLVKTDDGRWVGPREPGKKPAAAQPAAASQPAAADKPSQASPQPAAAPQAAPRVAMAGKPAAQAFDPTAEDALFTAVLKGKLPEAQAATKVALEAGLQPQDIINGQMIRAMGEIGQQFQNGKVFVPQLLMAARAMKGAMQLLQPLMAGQKISSLGKIVIGTVKGDLHDIGKNLVASMLEGCGFEVVDIGIDVPKEKYVEAVKEHHADILAISALLTTTMDYIPEVIQAVEQAGLRDKVKIMVGGAPLSQEFADQVGADGYSDNANSAVALAKRLLGK